MREEHLFVELDGRSLLKLREVLGTVRAGLE
jgi:hypothetical protein